MNLYCTGAGIPKRKVNSTGFAGKEMVKGAFPSSISPSHPDFFHYFWFKTPVQVSRKECVFYSGLSI